MENLYLTSFKSPNRCKETFGVKEIFSQSLERANNVIDLHQKASLTFRFYLGLPFLIFFVSLPLALSAAFPVVASISATRVVFCTAALVVPFLSLLLFLNLNCFCNIFLLNF